MDEAGLFKSIVADLVEVAKVYVMVDEGIF